MPNDYQQLTLRYQQTLDKVKVCAGKHQRPSSSVKLIAVSKRHSAEYVVHLLKLGQQDFAENYLQEAVSKIEKLQIARKILNIENKAVWHFIGHIQSNKCRQIAVLFHWVHTVDNSKVARKLNQHREGLAPLNVLIQINLQQEKSKSGVTIEDLPELAESIQLLPNLKLRGLMIIPQIQTDFNQQRSVFRQCRIIFGQLNQRGMEIDQLSMGMTGDMEAAIAEGATQIRIGTAIFGQRPG